LWQTANLAHVVAVLYYISLYSLVRDIPSVVVMATKFWEFSRKKISVSWDKPKFHLARHITSRHDSTRSTGRARRDERVEPKCMGSTSRTCRVVSRRDVTSQVECGLYAADMPMTMIFASRIYEVKWRNLHYWYNTSPCWGILNMIKNCVTRGYLTFLPTVHFDWHNRHASIQKCTTSCCCNWNTSNMAFFVIADRMTSLLPRVYGLTGSGEFPLWTDVLGT